jgi:branched-chain amino acid transport system ATP-binding protein
MPNILSGEGVCTFYRRGQALFDVSIDVPERGCVAVLGRNGAGKTTLLKTLSGDLLPARGSVIFDGHDVTRMPMELRVARGLGTVPQDNNIFAGMTVRENLEIGAAIVRQARPGFDEVVDLFPRLGERMDQKAGTLSGGERKMVAISRALLGRPSLMMLDEPTEGVWHGVVAEIAECLKRLAQRMAVLIVEQHVRLALEVSQRCYVMDRGAIALEGDSVSVQNDPALHRLLAP